MAKQNKPGKPKPTPNIKPTGKPKGNVPKFENPPPPPPKKKK